MSLTVQQAAAKRGVSVQRLRKFITQGRLAAVKHGRDWVIESGDLERLQVRSVGRPRKEKA